MRNFKLEKAEDGAVCVFDGTKTVRFLKEETRAPRGASEEVIVKSEEVIVKIRDEILPIDAARLYIECLELLRSCPRNRTEKKVYCNDMDSLSLREGAQNGPPVPTIEMKPKKITFRILEGEVV